MRARLGQRSCGDGDGGVWTLSALCCGCVCVSRGPVARLFVRLLSSQPRGCSIPMAPVGRPDTEPRMKGPPRKPGPGLGMGVSELQVPVWGPHGGSYMFRTTAFSESCPQEPASNSGTDSSFYSHPILCEVREVWPWRVLSNLACAPRKAWGLMLAFSFPSRTIIQKDPEKDESIIAARLKSRVSSCFVLHKKCVFVFRI